MEKIVVSSDEVSRVADTSLAGRVEVKLPPAMPWWCRVALAPLALVLPLLCLAAIVIRVAVRNSVARTKLAWTGYCSTLLIISGLLSTFAGCLAFFLAPLQPEAEPEREGSFSLDQVTDFPVVGDVNKTLSPKDLANDFKDAVFIVSTMPRW